MAMRIDIRISNWIAHWLWKLRIMLMGLKIFGMFLFRGLLFNMKINK